ncbi:MAG: HAMP domain-containing sensor histidine kinase [Mobilitalea sp.]
MWLNIVFGIISIISLSILFLYRRQVRSICRQLKFIENNPTNKIISTELDFKEIKELSECLNGTLKMQKQHEVDYRKKDNQLKDTITNISHDIRTPLTSLKGYFELLAESVEESDRRRYVQIINSRLTSLQDMVEQLFTYVKLQNESYQLVLEECNLNKILYEIVFSFYEDFKSRGMEPIISIQEKSSIISANEAGLRRVIQNVIKNSLDHGNEQIIIEMKNNDQVVEILVKNKYTGINKIDADKVFHRFYKADESRSNSSTGLGLSIAYELVKHMNGDITAFLEENLFVIKIKFDLCQINNTNQTE